MNLAEYIKFANQFRGLATNVKSIIKGKHLNLTFASLTSIATITGIPLVRDDKGGVSNKQEYIDILAAFDPTAVEPYPPKDGDSKQLEELYMVTLSVLGKDESPKLLKCIMRMMDDHLKVIAINNINPLKSATYRQMSAKTTTKPAKVQPREAKELQEGEAQE